MNTIKFLSNHAIQQEAFATNMRDIRASLFASGICWTDDVQGQFNVDMPFRVVLFTRNVNANFKNPMVKECNGLVLYYKYAEGNNGWTLLAMPQYSFCSNKISMKKLDNLFSADSYDVYEVLDATILTLYNYKDQWCASSTKGYDIGDTEMVAEFTFMDAIHDLLQVKYKAFQLENLNKEYSYTIALRHHKYHIFDEARHLANRGKPISMEYANSYIMIMCVVDAKACRYVSKNVHGLPHQSPLVFKSVKATDQEVAKQNVESTPREDSKSVQTLMNYARSAYAKYAKAHQMNQFKYKPLYGYILRAKNGSVSSEYSTIYFESELFRAIKLALYKNNSLLRAMDYKQLIIRMATSNERYEQFKIMFHQFSQQFDRLDQAMNAISLEAVRRISKSKGEDPTESDLKDINKLAITNVAATMIQELKENFQAEFDITSGLIKDAMFSKKYVHYLHEMLT